MRTARLLALLVALTVLLALPASATDGVSISPSATEVTYGDPVTLTGVVDPAVENETVQLLDADTSALLGTDQMDAGGAYEISIVPDANVSVKAVAGLQESAPVSIGVKPAFTVSLSSVRLFDRARITGTIQPSHDGPITVRLLRSGSPVAEVEAAMAGGTFQARLPIGRPGTYRAEISFPGDEDHLAATKKSGEASTRLPRLRSGSRGVYVLLLEGRLRALRYKTPRPDRRFDHRTGDAVLAFRKVQGMKRARTVTKRTWRKLASPRKPRARSSSPAVHFEVDQTKQLLYLVRKGKIRRIVHASTGGPGVGTTYDGAWRVHRKLAGYSPGRLYYPSYFHGNRAVHGWPEVPPTAASHGCVRVPMWTAQWLYGKAPMGRVVKIYHS
jgi:hypothetical protein